MPWIYVQKSGNLYSPSGEFLVKGYSGYGEGLNNPSFEDVIDVGPIPTGEWEMTNLVNSLRTGPNSIILLPISVSCQSRSGFRIHGDLIGHVGEHLASDGCIVIEPPEIRIRMWNSAANNSDFKRLLVIRE